MDPKATEVAVLMEMILPDLASAPYPESALEMLPNLCDGLKIYGALLETSHKDKLDILQRFLTELCKANDVDLRLRIKALELIELRSLGYKSNPMVDKYYSERFAQFAQSSKKPSLKSGGASLASEAKPSPSLAGSAVTTCTSYHELFPHGSVRERGCISVNGGVKIFLSSTDQNLVNEAKKLLSDYFMEQQVQVKKHRGIKYSRVDLLNLAKTPSSGVKMEWNKEIPQEILSAQEPF